MEELSVIERVWVFLMRHIHVAREADGGGQGRRSLTTRGALTMTMQYRIGTISLKGYSDSASTGL